MNSSFATVFSFHAIIASLYTISSLRYLNPFLLLSFFPFLASSSLLFILLSPPPNPVPSQIPLSYFSYLSPFTFLSSPSPFSQTGWAWMSLMGPASYCFRKTSLRTITMNCTGPLVSTTRWSAK